MKYFQYVLSQWMLFLNKFQSQSVFSHLKLSERLKLLICTCNELCYLMSIVIVIHSNLYLKKYSKNPQFNWPLLLIYDLVLLSSNSHNSWYYVLNQRGKYIYWSNIDWYCLVFIALWIKCSNYCVLLNQLQNISLISFMKKIKTTMWIITY